MKLIVTSVVFAQLATALVFSQTPQTVGAWSIYSSIDNGHHRSTTLIQTRSEEKYSNNTGQPVEAQMDAICVKGELMAVAVDTNSVVNKNSVNLSGPVDTIPVEFSLGNQPLQSESWAVLDHGRTLSPYAEILQGRRTRDWAARIAKSDKVVLHVGGLGNADSVKVTFNTTGLAQALSAAGCSY